RKLSIELGDDTPDQASVRASWPAAQTRDLIARILFDLVEANQSLIARVTPMIRESFRLGGEQAIAEHADASDQDAAELDPFRLADPEVAAGIRRRELMLTNINRRVRNQIGESIAQGIAQQETTSQIAERVRKQFNLEAGRANTVARTEIGRSVEEARHQGRLQVGTPLKSWLWSRRETGRPWHFDTETQTFESPIPAAADFRVAQTGNTCPHPRATNDPEDDINCGCTTIARFPGDSVKQVLARYLERGFTDTVRLRSLDERRTRTTVPNRRKEAA
ncbi:MAG: phage minor head protein, partial [Planctomycetota bacterium]